VDTNNSVRLISLDFDGTIYHSDFIPRLLDIIADECNEPLTLLQRRAGTRFVYMYFGRGYDQEALARAATEEDFFVEFSEQLMTAIGILPPVRRRAARPVTVRALALSSQRWLEPGLVRWLEGLRERGYKLALLTNRPNSVMDLCRELEIAHAFDLIVTRETVGAKKPDPAPFRHMLQVLNVAPHEAVHVGDNPFTDVEGAQASGVHPVLVDPENLFPEYHAHAHRVRRVAELEDQVLPHISGSVL